MSERERTTQEMVEARIDKYLSDSTARMNKLVSSARKRYELYDFLISEGVAFAPLGHWSLLEGTLHVTNPAHFRQIKALVGELTEDDKRIEDADKRTVRLTMRPKCDEYREITFSYVTTLPTNAKCDIVEEYIPPSKGYISKKLVCKV